ncbi:LexA-binding, inner membrane-associated putative hydrolase [Georgenia soli]|uniref:LexA-binding, inner membrane-associated putative hydrolase n=2 Tax=Georgenia soli TaxID=638953 RepID=A0A2A9EMM0_9MICO|nr:LexA-binding, inner membrane-associated putative hydrolase [Georgenia soli]
MMSHAHATTGAAAWLAVTATVPWAAGWVPLPPAEVLSGAVATAGAALLLDADHHAGTIARSLPPVSRWVARGLGFLSGGHRHATHSLLGVLGAGLIARALSALRVPVAGEDFQLGAWLMIVLLVAFAAKALRVTRGWLSSWAVSLTVATATTWFAPETTWWLPAAVVLGCLCHLAGDALTSQGVPLLWPLRPSPAVVTPLWRRNGHFALPLLGNAGSRRELVFVAVVDVYIFCVAAMTAVQGASGALTGGVPSWLAATV